MPLDPKAKLEYPLHWAVFTDDIIELRALLKQKTILNIDKLDPRGRSPLMLAVTIGHIECAKLLLENGADADSHNKQMWSVSNESVSLSNPDLIRDVIHYRDYQRSTRGSKSLKNTLNKLKDIPDFYCEMKWDFSSWVPFLTQACPSDTYKIYKKGSNVRIDTTLVSFEGTNWIRGDQSFMFKINEDNFAEFIILDHLAKTAAIQSLRDDEPFEEFKPSADAIALRLSTPITTTFIDVDQIGFEKTSRGILSWLSGSDSTEKVDGFDCKVLAASNVQLVTKKRTEHLSENDKRKIEQLESTSSSKAISSVMKLLQSEKSDERTTKNLIDDGLTAVEYLDPNFSFEPFSDIGRPREVTKKSNAFKATLWLADNFPLSLQNQIIPIVELMAVNSPHFARLHNFIRLQLPAGFPVKIEIPLFHVLSARINFQNVNEPGKYVTPVDVQSNFQAKNVVIDDLAFEIPQNYYSVSGDLNIDWNDENDPSINTTNLSNSTLRYMPSDEMLLQMAIEQSLQNSENSGVQMTDEELARALQIQFDSVDNNREQRQPIDSFIPLAEAEFANAIRASQAEDEQRRIEEERYEEELRKVLELSKLEK